MLIFKMVITKEELKELSKKLDLNMGQTELNYMHNLFLYAVSKISPNSLVFKGGTSLMICYNLDRFSEDLDFTLIKEINIEELLEKIVTFFNKFGYEANFKFKRETKSSKNYVFFVKGPTYMGKPESQTRVELDFSNRDDIYLDYVPKRVKHEFDDFAQFYINTLSLEEIFAEKVRCILTRDKARDIYDLYYLIGRNVKIDYDVIDKKLEIYDMKFQKEDFFNAVKNKRRLWEKEMSILVKVLLEFGEVEAEIVRYFN